MDNPLFLKYSRNTLDMQAYFYVHQKLEAVNNFNIISEDDFSQQFVYIKSQATFPLVTQDENILEALQELRKNVKFSSFLTFMLIFYFIVLHIPYILRITLCCYRLHLEE